MSAEHPGPPLPGLPPNHDLGDVDSADGKRPHPRAVLGRLRTTT
jgi:hypothetical protein